MVVDVLFVIHALSVFPSLTLGLLPVKPVFALGLGKLVDLSGSEASSKFLSKSVRDGLAYCACQ